MRIERREAFVDDLTEAYAYLAARTPRAADRFLDEVENLARLLVMFPKGGRFRPQLGLNIRSFPIRRFQYVAYYKVDGDCVFLLRLLHGARKVTRKALTS